MKTIFLLFFVGCAFCGIYGLDQPCPVGWTDRSQTKYCYQFNRNIVAKDWQSAREFCQRQLSRLIYYEDSAEMNWVSKQLNLHYASTSDTIWWSSLNKVNGSTWKWDNGDPIEDTLLKLLWVPNNPIGKKDYDCARIYYSNGKLQNALCTKKYSFVCKRDKNIPIPCDSATGWEHHDNHCYKIGNQSRTWQDARSACQLDESDLAVISNEAIDKTVFDMVRVNRENFWIGLKSERTNSQGGYSWTWVNESSVVYSAWYQGGSTVPKGFEDSTCALSLKRGSAGNSWSPIDCSKKNPYICQKNEGTCEPGWYKNGDMCYYPSADLLTWQQAQTFCQGYGGNLVNIKLDEHQTFVETLLDDINILKVDFIWIGMNQKSADRSLEWTTGGLVSTPDYYRNWQSRQPILSDKPDNCGRLYTGTRNNGQWSIAGSCSDENGFICQVPVNAQIPPTPAPPSPFKCENGWSLWDAHCYKFVFDSLSWQAARNNCKASNGELADIREVRQQEFIQSILKYNAWFGLNSFAELFVWQWSVDNTNLENYDNWAGGKPSNSPNQCVEMITENITLFGKWASAPCTIEKKSICKKPASAADGSTPTPPPEEPDWNPRCGPGWKMSATRDACFYLGLGPVSYTTGQAECRRMGGFLSSITGQLEQDFVLGAINTRHNQIDSGPEIKPLAYWIGLNHIAEFGYLKWPEHPLAYLNWDSSEPKIFYSKKCVKMSPVDGKWLTAKCEDMHGFICRKSPTPDSTTPAPPVKPTLAPGLMWGCPAGWKFYESMCYSVVADKNLIWPDAQIKCSENGTTPNGKLVTLPYHDVALSIAFQAMRLLPKYSPNIWIGMNTERDTAAGSRQFYWLGDSPVLYTDWSMFHPLDVGDCVFMNVNTRKWSVTECTKSLPFVCEQPAVGVPSTPTPPVTPGCPSGYQGHGYYCYKLVTSLTPISYGVSYLNQAKAAAECKKDGADLLGISDIDIQYHIQETLGEMGVRENSFWMGMKRDTGNIIWKLPSGDAVSYFNWIYPKSNAFGNCAVFVTTRRDFGKWDQVDCNDQKISSYICQKFNPMATTVAPPSPTPDTRTCQLGSEWSRIEGRCYAMFGNYYDKLSWSAANDDCLNRGAYLASIPNAKTNDALNLNKGIPLNYWIGLNILDKSNDYRWTDESPTHFFNWAAGQPNNHNDMQDCVQMDPHNRTWSAENCGAARRWICSADLDAIPPTGPIVTYRPPTGVPPDDDPCGDDRLGYKPLTAPSTDAGKFCFRVNTWKRGSWFDARDNCMKEGGNLFSILSIGDNQFVLQQVNKFRNGELWIGFNEVGFENGYKWSDGSPVNYINWNKDQPDDETGFEHCTTFNPDTGTWFDRHCESRFLSICKRPRRNYIPQTVPPPIRLTGGCPPKFTGQGNKCYRMIEIAHTWQDAEAYCESLPYTKVTLASVESEYENSELIVLSEKAAGDLWIGARKASYYVNYMWVDNARFVYSKWNHGEPEVRDNGCVQIHAGEGSEYMTGKWTTRTCADTAGFICMTYRVRELPTPQPPFSQCPIGYLPLGQNCFRFSNSKVTWKEARVICSSEAAMVSINNIYEQSFVHSLSSYREEDNIWIGLIYESGDSTGGGFLWNDGYPVTYTKWGSSQPRVQDDQQKCVVMQSNGTWATANCNLKLPYACSKKYDTPPTTEMIHTGSCPSVEWTEHAGHCYKFVLGDKYVDRLSFSQAEVRCRQQGGQLVSIMNKRELDLIVEDIEKKTHGIPIPYYDSVWIGLFQNDDGSFAWLDKRPVNYFNWMSGQPQMYNKCGALDLGTGQWRTMGCSDYKGYICKSDKVPLPTEVIPTSQMASTLPPVQPTDSERPPNINDFFKDIFETKKNNGLIALSIIAATLFLVVICLLIVYVVRRYQTKAVINAFNLFENDSTSVNSKEKPTSSFDNVYFDNRKGNVAIEKNSAAKTPTSSQHQFSFEGIMSDTDA